jgi:nicotinamidase-related amidase
VERQTSLFPKEVILPEESIEPPHLPITAGSTALLIVDVQPEYWSSCPAVRKDFPKFEENLAQTITTARKQRVKIIWVRADYRKQHSPWLTQFERLSNYPASQIVKNSDGRSSLRLVSQYIFRR